MRIGPKYKIARRLGPAIFDKTQTQKFAISEARKRKRSERPRSKSDFGLQLLEKQKARFTYGLNERQFAKYVANALSKKGVKNDDALYLRLETRLDNVIYRVGLAPTRQAARQMASHGHLLVNGTRITVPSYNLKVGDKFEIRQGSAGKGIFNNLAERLKDRIMPAWLSFDLGKRSGEVLALPKLVRTELPFDIAAILEFYRR